MPQKLKRLILLTIFITLIIPNIAYAEVPLKTVPFNVKVTDLKNKEDILNNLEQIKTIRKNLTTIDIRASSSQEQLQTADEHLRNYIQQMESIIAKLKNHINTYTGSLSDEFFSEQVILIARGYIISLRYQQLLVGELQRNTPEAKELSYSSYLITIYFNMTRSDQMIAYIDTYLTYS
ncbi:hypothetical protein CDLVIII_3783 [Clostridium sp. DL-VIII]|uniref:hypothetical protein n=1 Tax=Clostridium sp. DL-VIII TaxID=641107 RepID=UPI00023AFF4A|nr:hypothetical protein [Clostridium sp. DL-VIII]EHJ00336.1 hypothetical protein CDLVIII_3783 [Clostridium sp. DL-VIII]